MPLTETHTGPLLLTRSVRTQFQAHPSINDKRHSCNKTGLVAGQPHYGIGNVVRTSRSLQRRVLGHEINGLIRLRCQEQRSLGRPRGDSVDSDAVRSVIHRIRPAQTARTGLGGSIGCHAIARGLCQRTRDDHDAAPKTSLGMAFLLQHLSKDCAFAQKYLRRSSSALSTCGSQREPLR